MIVQDDETLKVDAVIVSSDDTDWIQISQFIFHKASVEWHVKLSRIRLDTFVRITDKLVIPHVSQRARENGK